MVFEKSEGNVGEPLQAQLVISSFANSSAASIRLSDVKIGFEGCLRPIKVQSDNNAEPDITTSCTIESIFLREAGVSTDSSSTQSPNSGGPATLKGIADLTIGPSQTKVVNLTCIPREAGEARVASITMSIEEEKFDLSYFITNQSQREFSWWQQTPKGISKRRVGKDRDVNRCRIKRKPPKIRITTPNLRSTYYTNEPIILTIGIHNDEEETADVLAGTRLFGHPESLARLQWANGENNSGEQDTEDNSTVDEEDRHFIKRPVGVMEHSSKKELSLVLTDTNDASDYQLEISVVYHLLSDVQTPIIKTETVGLSIIRPFEANYEFLPRLHPEPWPDFFHVDDELLEDGAISKPRGLHQKWCLDAKLVSFALESLIINKVSVVLLSAGGGTACNIGPETIAGPEKTTEIAPEELRECQFVLDVQKVILGDRRPTALNLALEIHWRRRDSAEGVDQAATVSTLDIPRFVAPAGEPRVLASAITSNTLSGLIHMDYILENPSTHFLTFNLTMEASEQFAFSGPKTTVVQLAPLSRHTVRYNLLAVQRGLWIAPTLVVLDTYFNKILRVLPTDETRSDKKGILVWVDADD